MTGPYAAAARAYFDAGWSPIPFPPKSKWPPVDGYTGANGAYVDEVTLARWLKPRAKVSAGKLSWVAGNGNIGLRLPKHILGIDVDMYDDKTGRATLAAAEKAWGPLPATWYTSSRSDGSGIRLFRIPVGLAWPGKLPQGGGVELIRWDHRYALVAPSVHPDSGEPYLWWRTDNVSSGPCAGEFPDPNAEYLPELPAEWVEGLTGGKAWSERTAANMDADEVRDWISARNGPKLCSVMRSTLTRYSREVRTAGDDGGVHDLGRDGAWALIGDAGAGHSGLASALSRLRKVFNLAVSRRADERLAAEEWTRIVIRGVQKVAAEGEPETDDLCALLANSRGDGPAPETTAVWEGPGDSGVGSGGFDYTRDDVGNAQRLIAANRHDLRYTNALGGWLVWNAAEGRWVIDGDGEVRRRAIDVVRGMEQEAQFIEDPAQRAAFLKFARSCGNIGRLTAMVTVAADMADVTVPAGAWDSDTALLGTGPSGYVELCDNPGVKVRPAIPELRVTRSCGVGYDSGASSPLWDAFLERFVPDPEICSWLQKLVGYSIHGGNPQRLFIVCFGPTSTGKTTFAEALRAALGDYAASVNLTIFRDNQDERARADLVRALRKRFVYAEEASSNWHLHPDQVKRLTGGTSITARLPFAKEYIEAVPDFTPWLLTNSAPTIEGADLAFWRRVLVVPFMQTVPRSEEDSAMRLRLMTEARAAVLAWAVRGWEMYAADPALDPPIGTFQLYGEFKNEVSELDTALAEICDFGSEFFEFGSALYRAYQMWCQQNGVSGRDVKSNTAFGRVLSGRGVGRIMRWVEVDGKKTARYVRSGIRLNDTWRALVGGD